MARMLQEQGRRDPNSNLANRQNRPWVAGLCTAFMAFTGPLLLRDVVVFDDVDERLFHLPVIQQFSGQFPLPDLSDYPSATTPLYHLAMSLVAVVFGDGLDGLRFANLLISLGALVVAWRVLAHWGSSGFATLFAGALAASPYFIGPSIRLSTDNAALLAVFAAIALMAPDRARPKPAGWATAAAVLTRQLHAWLIGVMLCLRMTTATLTIGTGI